MPTKRKPTLRDAVAVLTDEVRRLPAALDAERAARLAAVH